MYLGQTRLISAAEVLWDQLPEPGDDPDGPRIARVCHRYRFAQLRPTAPVRLLRLDEGNADAIGALPELTTSPSDEYPLTQEWARAIYEDLGVQGVYYRGAHNQGPCIALWDNAPKLQVVRDSGRARDASVHAPGVWDRIVVEYAINNRALAKIEPFACVSCRRLGLR